MPEEKLDLFQFAAVDVAQLGTGAAKLVRGAAGSFANNPEGIAALGAFCQAHQVDLVAMEATGGAERQAFAQLCPFKSDI